MIKVNWVLSLGASQAISFCGGQDFTVGAPLYLNYFLCLKTHSPMCEFKYLNVTRVKFMQSLECDENGLQISIVIFYSINLIIVV